MLIRARSASLVVHPRSQRTCHFWQWRPACTRKHISRFAAVFIVTADAVCKTYQYGVTKHVKIQCKCQGQSQGFYAALLVAAVSSLYGFLVDEGIETYVCAYNYTPMSLNTWPLMLANDYSPQVYLRCPLLDVQAPERLKPKTAQEPQHLTWLVEIFHPNNNWTALQRFFQRSSSAGEYFDEFKAPHKQGQTTQTQTFFTLNISTKIIFEIFKVSIIARLAEGRLGAVLVDQVPEHQNRRITSEPPLLLSLSRKSTTFCESLASIPQAS